MDWNNFDDWLTEIENNTPSINVAAQIGHGNLRSYAMGMEARERGLEVPHSRLARGTRPRRGDYSRC